VSSGNVMSCSLVEIYQYIRQTYCFCIQGKRISFFTEGGRSKFLQNTSKRYITWWDNSDDSNLHSQYHQSLKSRIVIGTTRSTYKADQPNFDSAIRYMCLFPSFHPLPLPRFHSV